MDKKGGEEKKQCLLTSCQRLSEEQSGCYCKKARKDFLIITIVNGAGDFKADLKS